MMNTFVLPTSFGQQRIWFVEELTPGRATYNIPVALRVRGALDVAAIGAAARFVVERHETLRTTFDVEDGVPVQVVHPVVDAPIELVDFTAEADAPTAALAAMRASARCPFNLRIGPLIRFTLFRVATDEHLLLAVMHHIIADGWSIGVLFGDLAEGYAAAVGHREPALPELTVQYADFVLWQREQLAGDALVMLETYWRDQLHPPLPALDVPTTGSRPADHVEGRAGRHAFRIPDGLAASLAALARQARATPFMLYLAAFQLLLARYAGTEDVIVGSPVAGRGDGGRELEPLIGLFINMLPLRTDLSGDPTFLQLLDRVREVTLGALAHHGLPFEQVVAAVRPGRDTSRAPIFQAVFTMQNAVSATGPQFQGLTVERLGVGTEFTMFELGLTMVPDRGSYRGSIEFDAALYAEDTIARLVGHFLMLLEAAAATPDSPVSSLDSLTADERVLVLETFNQTDLAVPGGVTVTGLVSDRARRAPDQVALLYDGQALTRGELEQAADRFARRLRAAGVMPGSVVAVFADRSPEMIVGLLGVLRAGGAFVGIDPEYPADRVSFMFEDSGATIVLTQAGLMSQLPPTRATAILIDDLIAADSDDGTTDAQATVTYPAPDDIAYILYTSGSTGTPKAVLVPHRCLVNHVHWMQDAVPLTEADRAVQLAPLSFDTSMWEIFGPLVFGVPLVLSRPGANRDTAYAVDLMVRERVTIVQSVPSLLRAMFDTPGIASCTSVRALILGGEALTPDLVARASDLMPWARVYNGYGPTETTIDATWWEVPPGPVPTVVPIGAPIANARAYVLSPAGQAVPIGVAGELYIGGAGVSAGYLNRPELSAQRFIADPFSPIHGARMYRTGDRVRWRSDGNLEYLGRLDDQVKLRGQRIEFGEIEAVLLQQTGIGAAAVLVRNAAGGDLQLVAFVVAAAGAALTAVDVRARLRKALPPAMVPATITFIDHLPLNVSGKVDRRALAARPIASSVLSDSYVAPRNPLEAEIAMLWASLLGRDRVGVHDDFFDLGGHSLLAMRMIAQIERLWMKKLPLRQLLEHPTVAQIVTLIVSSLNDDEQDGATVLQQNGLGTPLAFVHGDLLGAGWYCRRLALLLGDAPMVVLQTFGPGSHATIEAMAAAHVESLQAVQPKGPYRVGGFCQGGLVAYEMARQLSAQGETVESAILVDALSVNARFLPLLPVLRLLTHAATEAAALDRRVKVYLHVHYFVRRLAQIRRMNVREKIHWAASAVRRRLRPTARAFSPPDASVRPPAESDELDPTVSAAGTADLERIAKFSFVRHAQRGYIPGPYPGRVDIIRASEIIAGRPWAGRGGGFELVAEDLHLHTIEGTHEGLIAPEGLPALAACIRACLVRGERQT